MKIVQSLPLAIWFEEFQPIVNGFTLADQVTEDSAVFTIYPPDFETVVDTDVSKVWTILKAGALEYITNGLYTEDALGYYITKVSWNSRFDYYIELSKTETTHEV
jgi:hypothetical protein